MRLILGAYSFDANANLVTTAVDVMWNQGGQPYAQKRSFSVEGYLSGDGQADLTQKENALRTAFAQSYPNLYFLQDSGQNSADILPNAGSITGVRITHFAFPKANGPEYATIRSFSFTAEAEYPIPNTGNLLLNFTESLTFWGGGPIYAHRLAINGPPQKQLIYPQSTFSCTQVGMSVGYRAYPSVSPAKFPGALKEAPRISQKSPTRMGNGYQGYEVNWSYLFESAGPLVAVPTLWVN